MLRVISYIKSVVKNNFIYQRFSYLNKDEAEQVMGTIPHFEYHPSKVYKGVVHNLEQNGEKLVFGKFLESTIAEGETKIISYNKNDEKASITLKNDGSVLVVNVNSSITLKADGEVVLKTNGGETHFKNDKSVEFQNGALFKSDGDIVTAQGVSLNKHGHIGNLGSLTADPILSGGASGGGSLPSGEVSTQAPVHSIKATQNLTGASTVSGGEVNAGGKSMSNHKHTDSQGGQTSEPL